MNRTIAGVYDPAAAESREATRARLTAALSGDGDVTILEEGPLTLAWAGSAPIPPAREGDVLCLMDGHLYNAADGERALALAFGRDGEAALPALRGDFALVLFDRATQRGLLCCDQRAGRSLVFHVASRRLLFASDARCLLQLLPRQPEPDVASLAHWIGISSPPGDRTMFSGVRRVRPAHLVRLDPESAEQRVYWRPRHRETIRISRDEAVAEVRAGLERAIDRRVRPGEKAGVMLSGGLDSSSVCALAKHHLPRERQLVAGYSAVFPRHASIDESQLIAELAADTDLPSVRIAVEEGSLLAATLEYIDRWQIPPISPNLFFWTPLLRRAAQDGVQVLLDGEGGDELFAFSGYLLADRLRRGRLPSILSLVRSFPSGSRELSLQRLRWRLKEYALRPLVPPAARRIRRRFRPPENHRPGWFAPATSRAFEDTNEEWAWRDARGPKWAAWWAYTLTGGGSVAGYDHIGRRAALAGLEARHPLSDVDLIELIARLPPEYAFDHRHSRPLLREATKGVLPDSIRLRRDKSTFDEVFHEAIQGHDREHIWRLLSSPHAELGAYVDLELMRRELLEAPPPVVPAERQHWFVQLWRLTTAECWLRTLADPSFPDEVRSSGALKRPVYELVAPF